MNGEARGAATARVVFEDDLDATSERVIVERIDEAADGVSIVVVDLSHVTFCDSSALRAFLTAQARLDRDGVTLVIGPASRPVERLFEVSGAAEILNRGER
jgi:anti-anti-sigma factor